MSGGIDSTTISAIAAQEHPGIKAFTLSYEKDAPGYEELTQAKATARMYPMQHIIKQVNPEETLQYLIDMVKCYEEPYYSLSPNYIISKLVAENGIKVILNGLGGDELFCGYNRQCLLKLWGWLKSAHLFLKPLPPFNSKLKKLKELSSLADIYEYYLYMFSVFTEDKKHRLFRNISAAWNSYETFKSLYGLNGMKFCEGLEALSYMDLVNYISNHQVYRLDQFTMNFSIEGRLPFLDYEFIELACRIPGRLKVSRGVSKYILRKVSKKLIDPSSLRMKKKGFGLPVDQWINDKLSALTTDCLERLKKRDIFNNAEIDTIYRDHRHYNQSKIWQLVMIELWLEELIEKRISS
jgi:asparagine synthase (glutamine-hydrolysing)